MKALGLADALQPRLVTGERPARPSSSWCRAAPSWASRLCADHKDGKLIDGSKWLVPGKYHTPTRQDAVRCSTRARPARRATALMGWPQVAAAVAVIRAYGYDL